ncbi:MAG: hypothetical protein ACOZBW_13805 [Thermodesulfobacteriota bacterium]
MKSLKLFFLLLASMAVFAAMPCAADEAKDMSETIGIFKASPQVQPFFDNAYGYAVFPVIGKAGLVVGGAYGQGQVYRKGTPTGKADLVALSVGWQAGGQAFSQMIFFEDKRAYDEFTGGPFAFDAQASAVVVTASVQAKAGTEGATASATAGPKTGAQAAINYYKGMAVFVHPIGGLMYEAAIAGQKFVFTPY